MSADAPSIFTKIVNGEIPAHRVYETDAVLAFLDIGPLAPGHVLLIPKAEYDTIDKVPDETAAELGAALPRIVRAVKQATGAAGVNVLQNNGKASGQEVPHVHFHIIPRAEGDGWGYRWHPKSYATGEAEQIRDTIAALLKG